jgi:hypothetical protein
LFLEAVRLRRTLSYSEVARRAGPPLTQRTIRRQLLEPLSERCRRAGLPNLTALVVRKDTGLPGGGWFDPRNPGDGISRWAEALADCYSYRWPNDPDSRLLETP